MISAEDQRQLTFSQNLLSFSRQILARAANLSKMFQFVARFWRGLLFFNIQIAKVANFIAKLSDAPIEPRDAQCGWTELDTCHAGAIGQWHSNNADSFLSFGV